VCFGDRAEGGRQPRKLTLLCRHIPACSSRKKAVGRSLAKRATIVDPAFPSLTARPAAAIIVQYQADRS